MQAETKIQSSLVIDEHRMAFLPRHFGGAYLLGEQMLYQWARRLSPEYSGGHWLFFELDNGGFYAAPETAGVVSVCWPMNCYEGRMGAEAFGIVVTLYVICQLCEREDGERFVGAFYALRAFALEHAEAREILRAID